MKGAGRLALALSEDVGARREKTQYNTSNKII